MNLRVSGLRGAYSFSTAAVNTARRCRRCLWTVRVGGRVADPAEDLPHFGLVRADGARLVALVPLERLQVFVGPLVEGRGLADREADAGTSLVDRDEELLQRPVGHLPAADARPLDATDALPVDVQ